MKLLELIVVLTLVAMFITVAPVLAIGFFIGYMVFGH